VVSAKVKETTIIVPQLENVVTDIASTALVTKSSAGNPDEAQVLSSTTSANDDAISATAIAITADSEITTLSAVAGNSINICRAGLFQFSYFVILGCTSILALEIYEKYKVN
jgi:hypothetical protein